MKLAIKTLVLFVFLMTSICWLNCGGDNNPLSPGSLAGTYKLLSITDKTENVTINAGEETDIGDGVTITVTGTLVLTETRFTFTITLTTSIPGLPPETETETVSGTYSVSGSTMTIVVEGTGETQTFTIRRDGNRLTLEDDEQILVFEKQ